MNVLEQRFRETLRKRGVRLTSARNELFHVLQQAHEPLPLAAVLKQAQQANRASVYRNINLFEKLGIVSALLIGWKKRYELAAPFKGHHHHIFCEQCGRVVSVDSPSLERVIKTVAEAKGFYLRQHTLELSGLCAECAGKMEGLKR